MGRGGLIYGQISYTKYCIILTMIWVDREVKKIKERGKKLEWTDDMKTPSGKIHVGALRGPVIHDLIYRVLKENGVNAHNSYVFNDFDQMDAVPSYLEFEKWEKYAGMPLSSIPSPVEGFKNYAQYYSQEFIDIFTSIGCHPEIIWGSELYKSGKMNDAIRAALDKADIVRTIYERITKKKGPKDWHALQVICEKCGKMGTTYVSKWDGTKVTYTCRPEMAAWAQGCGHSGQVDPFDGRAKLHWKVDWAANWKIIGITIESSGKDHMSAGGSYDVSRAIAEEVFNYEAPYAMNGYEFFTIGGRKMSSSKGIGSTAADMANILPPDLLRFLITRTPIERHLDFNPFGDTIPNLFDDFDRCLKAYYDRQEDKLPDGKQGEVLADFARILELSAVRPLSQTRIFSPRFRTIVNLINSHTDIPSFFAGQKGSKLSEYETEILEERIKYAGIYIAKYAGEISAEAASTTAFVLNDVQKEFLHLLSAQLKKATNADRDALQTIIFGLLKENNYKPKEVFQGFYQTIIGRDFGAKAADLILQIGVHETTKKLDAALGSATDSVTQKSEFALFNDPSIFSINSRVFHKFPTISVGVAIIKNVSVVKHDEHLQREITEFIKTQAHLTNEHISAYPEVQSYRKMYKLMGVDWHSKRPSPEALLRRVSQKKDLYTINTCVDAYNLIVMKNRVSIGAFDLDKLSLPTHLRFAEKGEKILLLGDKTETEYKETEVAYFDKSGGYNIDFNYRDAQRTAVSETTQNIFLNVDGVYDITPQQVAQSLEDAIEIILRYCGGTVESQGIVTA